MARLFMQIITTVCLCATEMELKSKIFAVWPFKEKFANPCPRLCVYLQETMIKKYH